MEKYKINNSRKRYTVEEVITTMTNTFEKEGSGLFSTFDVGQYRAMLEIRLINENADTLNLTIGGEQYHIEKVKTKKEKKLTSKERIKILEEEVQKLKEILKRNNLL